MKNVFKILAVIFVSLGAIITPTSVAFGALSQYGLPGIYNSSLFTLQSGQGSAIATDARGRMQISPESSISSLAITSLTTTNFAVTGQFSIPVSGVALETLNVVNASRTATTSITSQSIIFGSAPATTGTIRFSRTSDIVYRNAANNTDYNLLSVDASNRPILGNGVNATLIAGDVGFVGDGLWDIGGGTRSPRNGFFKGLLGVGTASSFATFSLQGNGTANPMEVRSSTAASMFIILTNGNVGIGTSTPSHRFAVEMTTEGNLVALKDSDGLCLQDPDSGGLTTSCSSDEKLKLNIKDSGSALEGLTKLPVEQYNIKASGKFVPFGPVAQHIQKVEPGLVSKEKDTLMVEEVSSWRLVKAIQELSEKNKAQDKEIQSLRKSIPGATPWYRNFWKLLTVLTAGLVIFSLLRKQKSNY